MTTDPWDIISNALGGPPDKPTPPARPPITLGSAAPDTRYAASALEQEAQRVIDAAPGSRNHALNRAAFSLGQLVAGGALAADDVQDALAHAGRQAGLDDREIPLTIASGLAAGAEQPRGIPPRDQPPTTEPLDPPAGVNPTTGEVPPTLEELAERAHQRRVRDELNTLRAREEAKRLYVSERAALEFREPPYRPNLTAELLEPRLPTRYAVQDLLPAGGNALLTAQYKAGKTTCVTELARAWVDRLLFLGRYTIHSQRRVALWNYELSQNQYNEWLDQSGIDNTDDISVLHLRGFRLDLRSKKGEDWAGDWLKDHDIGLWIPDPFARAAVGIDENSNSEVGVWLDTLDVIKERAGVDESVLPIHTGRAQQEQGQERARGATRLDDWADVRWLLTKDEVGDRFFRATGRDVEMEEEKLSFEAETHRLTIGGGDRAWVKKRRVEDAAVSYVETNPGSNSTTIATGIGVNKTDVPTALAAAVAHHRLRMVPGRGTEKLYYPPSAMPPEDPFDS